MAVGAGEIRRLKLGVGACGRPAQRERTLKSCMTTSGAILLVLALAGPAKALTYYVRATGSDINDGVSPATALASIRGAAALLHAPGDHLVVGPGLYREGNIQPRGSGTPDDPIVLLADVTGALTGDAPGPVTITPPNSPDATTGFIVFGRRDIRIEGFAIEGAADAGVQVRAHSSLDVDSSRITIRNNTIRSGQRRGIDVTAAGDVAVTDNLVSGHFGAGVALRGGTSGALRPLVTGNVIEENDVGLSLDNTFGATVSVNTLRSNRRGIIATACSGLAIDANDIDASAEALVMSESNDATVTGNTLRRDASISSTNHILLARNRFLNAGGKAVVSPAEGGDLTMLDNELPRLWIRGMAVVEMIGNTAQRLIAEGSAFTATDNIVTEGLEMRAATELEMRGNRAASLAATATAVLITECEFAGQARINAFGGTVTDNRVGSLAILSRPTRTSPPKGEGGPFLVSRNTVGGAMQLGEVSAPALGAVVEDNTVFRHMRISAAGELQVRRNQARGIACLLDRPESTLVLAENVSAGHFEAGLIVRGASRAVIEGNTASNNKDTGLAVRAVGALSVTGNTFISNGAGGISIVPLAGDCNGNHRVTVDELVAIVSIALGRRPLYECAAADSDADTRLTIDEVVAAVATALALPTGAPGSGGTVEIRANRVEDNADYGINVVAAGSVLAIGNRALRNEGIAIAARSLDSRAAIDVADNVLGLGGGEGVYVEGSSAARVRNNVIFSHHEAGILLRNTPGAAIVNNLIYANGNDGIAVGAGIDNALPAAGTVIMNNTLYANGDFGVTIGNATVPSTGVVILNNVIDSNVSGGIAADVDSLSGLTIGFNLNTDGYGHGVTPAVTDFVADPRFVAPAGPDGVLGGDGFADDDFHLRDTAPASAAIDAGSSTAVALHITGSAIAGREIDEGIVDLGYHYGAADGESPPSRP